MDHLTVSHNYPSINERVIIGTRKTALGKGEDGRMGGGEKKKTGEWDWLLIVLWLINKAIDQSACSRRGTYTGSRIAGNNLSSRGVNPSKRGGCGLIVWGMGGFLRHAEMINAAVRLRHKHNSCSKCLNGYEWFRPCMCAQLWECYMKTLSWEDVLQEVWICSWGFFFFFFNHQRLRENLTILNNNKNKNNKKPSRSHYLNWLQRRL